MDFELHNLFPVPLFKGTFSNAEKLRSDLVPKLLEKAEADSKDNNYCETGYTSYSGYDDNVLFYPECEELLDFVGRSVAGAHNNCGMGGNVGLLGSWFTINRRYAYHEKHNHLPCVWSGVYYVQSTIEDSGITFINSNLDTNWPYNSQKRENNDYNSGAKTLFNETGTILIFPSYLWHKVDQQTNDNERITIAFNFGSVDA